MKELIPLLVKAGTINRRAAQLLVRRLHRKPNGCWEWYGQHTNGVACFSVTRAAVSAQWKVHRLLYAATHPGAIITGMVVKSICGDPACPNPWHREHMTRKQYVDSTSNAVHRTDKLNCALVHRINRMPPTTNWAQVARDIGVSPSTVRLIRAGKAWRHCVPTQAPETVV